MVRIIGNSFHLFLIFCCVWMIAEPSALLKLQSLDGDPIERIGVGEQCKLELLVTGLQDAAPTIDIAGLDEATSIVDAGAFSISIGDHTTIQQNYQLSYEKPGLYELGPAQVKTMHGTMSSNRIVIEVVRSTLSGPTSIPVRVQKNKQHKKDKTISATLTLSINTEHVFVGQKISCTLTLSFFKGEISLKRLIDAHLPFKPINSTGPHMHAQTIDGQEYEIATWQWDMYPERAGEFVVPRYYADLLIAGTQISPFWFVPQTKRICSNDVSFKVWPLPEHVPDTIPVGTFTSYRATAVPTIIKQGEATTITLELEGDTNWEKLSIDTINGLDEKLRAYPSRQQLVTYQKTNTPVRKKFEFVVHGVHAGTFEIPVQTLSYFDVDTQQQETIMTEPLTLTVLGVTDNKTISFMPPTSDNLYEAPDTNELIIQAMVQRNPSIYISGWLFFLLFCLPLLSLLWFCKEYCIHKYQQYSSFYYAKKRAHAAIAKAAQDKNGAAIYYIFTSYLALKTARKPHEISDEFCQKLLHNKKIAAEYIEQWQQFLMQAIAYAFDTVHARKPDASFFDQAGQWLNFWEKIW